MHYSIRNKKHLDRAYALAVATIIYNVIEGLLSVGLGMEDGTYALMGFGLDSFVEVVSGIGIWHMVRRMRAAAVDETPDRFERTALRVTGLSFYALAVGLSLSGLYGLWKGHAPETTLWGVVIALLSIAVMWVMLNMKLDVGRELNSAAVVADAHCTRACMYFSVALLVSSAGYELTGIGGLDALGALAIAALSFKEGREAMGKSRGESCGCGGGCG